MKGIIALIVKETRSLDSHCMGQYNSHSQTRKREERPQ